MTVAPLELPLASLAFAGPTGRYDERDFLADQLGNLTQDILLNRISPQETFQRILRYQDALRMIAAASSVSLPTDYGALKPNIRLYNQATDFLGLPNPFRLTNVAKDFAAGLWEAVTRPLSNILSTIWNALVNTAEASLKGLLHAGVGLARWTAYLADRTYDRLSNLANTTWRALSYAGFSAARWTAHLANVTVSSLASLASTTWQGTLNLINVTRAGLANLASLTWQGLQALPAALGRFSLLAAQHVADFLGIRVDRLWAGIIDIGAFLLQLPSLIWQGLKAVVSSVVVPAFNAVRDFAYDTIDEVKATIFDPLFSRGKIHPNSAILFAPSVWLLAFSFGMGSKLLGLIPDNAQPFRSMGIPQLSAFGADMGQFSGIAAATMGVLIALGLRQPFFYAVNNIFRPRFRDVSEASDHFAKRVINFADLRQIAAWQGFSDLEAQQLADTAGRPLPISGFRAMADTLHFDLANFQRMVQDAGYSRPFQDALATTFYNIPLSKAQALKVGALRKLANDGMIDIDTYIQAADPSGARPDIQTELRLAAAWEFQHDYVAGMRTAYRDLAQAEAISVDDYRLLLTTLGFRPLLIDLDVFRVQARLRARRFVQAFAGAESAIRQTQTRLVQAYTLAFRKGLSDPATLLNQLVVAGLEPDLARATVQLETIRIAPPAEPDLGPTTRQLIAQTNHKNQEADVLLFRRGLIDAGEFEAMLLSHGMDATVAEATVRGEQVRALEPPALQDNAADEQTQRTVQRIFTDAFRRATRAGFLDLDQLQANLLQLGLDPDVVDAIVFREQVEITARTDESTALPALTSA